jgi:hypothetical protein
MINIPTRIDLQAEWERPAGYLDEELFDYVERSTSLKLNFWLLDGWINGTLWGEL